MIVGTAGHIDHGKTALVRALTGVDTDRLPEEKRRGITIDLGFAYKKLASGETLGFIDVPGHEKFVHNMLAGAAGIDFVLLVVAADDGVMPQTREHVQILDLLALNDGIVALTKADLAPPERLGEVAADIRALLNPTTMRGFDILPVSAVTGAGVPELAARLEATAASSHGNSQGGRFRLSVDRAFLLTGTGIVVTGTVFAGQVKLDDRLILSPSGIPVRIRKIHAQNKESVVGLAGQRCALNLVGADLNKSQIERGDWVTETAGHNPTDRMDVTLRLLASEKKLLRHWAPAHVHLAAAHGMGHVALLDCKAVEPGGTALAQIILERPLGALHGDRFILRDQSAQRTIAGGAVLDPFPPSRNRRTPDRLAALIALRQRTPVVALAKLLDVSPNWIDLKRFTIAWNLTEAEAETLWPEVPMNVGRAGEHLFGFAPQLWAGLRERTVAVLTEFHRKSPDVPGMDRSRLRPAIQPRLSQPVFDILIASLLHEKIIATDGPWLRLPAHRVTLTAQDEKLWSGITAVMEAARFEPPRVGDLARRMDARELDVRNLLRRLARMGKVVLVAHDHYFLRETVAEMVGLVDQLGGGARRGDITAVMFRDRIGTGRKLAILILEFFDRSGVTIRTGDLRRVERHRLETFGPISTSERIPA